MISQKIKIHKDKKLILNFIGAKGNGKDLTASLAMNMFEDATRIAFADPLKNMVWSMFGKKIGRKEYLWGNIEDKEKEIDYMPISEEHRNRYKILKSHNHWTGRLLLQWFGSEICREIDEMVWIRISMESIMSSTHQVIVTTDCRFRNEYVAFSRLSVDRNIVLKFIRIDRMNNVAKDAHQSEQGWKDMKYDELVLNDGSIADLEHNTTKLIAGIISKEGLNE